MSNVAYIIPIKFSGNNNYLKYQLNNLKFNLEYTLKKFNFNIYLIEQNKEISADKIDFIKNLIENKKINYNFIYRDNFFIDRGHIFNCAIKHFLKYNEEIIICGDCDMPLLKNTNNLIKLIEEKKYKYISPYKYLIKLNENESIINKKLLLNNKNIRYNKKFESSLYTITGGIFIFNKEEFINLGLWPEYGVYGGEDRSLDVILLELYKEDIYQDNYTYIHMYHPHWCSIFNNLVIKQEKINQVMNNVEIQKKYYNCTFDFTKYPKYAKINFHKDCKHNKKEIWYNFYKKKKGKLDKYK